MSKGKNYVRKGVARHITLSREADEFLRESVPNASRFIDLLLLISKTGICPVLFTVYQKSDGPARTRTGDLRRVRATS